MARCSLIHDASGLSPDPVRLRRPPTLENGRAVAGGSRAYRPLARITQSRYHGLEYQASITCGFTAAARSGGPQLFWAREKPRLYFAASRM